MSKRILYIDPVPSNKADLQPIADHLSSIKLSDTHLEVISTNSIAPLHVTYPSYEALASGDVLKLIHYGVRNNFDAIIVGCFYDPMVVDAREFANSCIILGPCLSSLQIAEQLANRTTILSVGLKATHRIKQRVHEYGFENKIASIRDIGMEVVDFCNPDVNTAEIFIKEGEKAIKEDGAEALILGCSMNFTDYAIVQKALNIPVIDSITAALKKAELHAELKQKFGWSTSQCGTLSAPPQQEIDQFDMFDQCEPPIGQRIIVS